MDWLAKVAQNGKPNIPPGRPSKRWRESWTLVTREGAEEEEEEMALRVKGSRCISDRLASIISKALGDFRDASERSNLRVTRSHRR